MDSGVADETMWVLLVHQWRQYIDKCRRALEDNNNYDNKVDKGWTEAEQNSGRKMVDSSAMIDTGRQGCISLTMVKGGKWQQQCLQWGVDFIFLPPCQDPIRVQYLQITPTLA